MNDTNANQPLVYTYNRKSNWQVPSKIIDDKKELIDSRLFLTELGFKFLEDEGKQRDPRYYDVTPPDEYWMDAKENGNVPIKNKDEAILFLMVNVGSMNDHEPFITKSSVPEKVAPPSVEDVKE